MTKEQFQKLRYGNIIKDNLTNRKFAVTLTLRDKDENLVHAALTRAIDADDATSFDLVSSDRVVSFITGQTINES